jgi:hypothetical protein
MITIPRAGSQARSPEYDVTVPKLSHLIIHFAFAGRKYHEENHEP